MERNLRIVFSLVIFLRVIFAQSEYFTVVGSKTLRADEPYLVAVTSHSSNAESRTFSVGIDGHSFSGDYHEVHEEVTVAPGKCELTLVHLPNLSQGLYQLKVSSVAANIFKSVPIHFNPQLVSLFIQLSKPLFRPDDLLEFRVFTVDSRSRPYRVAHYSKIWILDPGNHQIKVWQDPQFHKALHVGSLKLTDAEPGMWKIVVEVDGEFESKSFEVRQDKRPIFELELTPPGPSVSYRDGSIKIKIKIKIKVKSAIIGSSGFTGVINAACDEKGVRKYQQSLRIEDETVLEIDFKNDLKIPELKDTRNFNLRVDFIHDGTNKTFSESTKFKLEMSEFIISIVHSPLYYKPGISYSFTLLVSRMNGYPLLNSSEPIEVHVEDETGSILLHGNYSLDSNTGSVEIEVTEIPTAAVNLTIKAKFDRVNYVEVVHKTPTIQKQFLSINVLTPRPTVYEKVEFEIKSSTPVPFVVFQVFSKGVLKASQIIKLTNGKASHTLTPRFSYTPRAHCIVYFVNDDGEIISDSIRLLFENKLPNYVELTVEPSHVKPGGRFSMNVSSTLNSTVSLLAIDQRALKLDRDYDITLDHVINKEMIHYDEVALSEAYDVEIPYWFYKDSYQKKFFDVGAVIVTNAVQIIPCKPNDTLLSNAPTPEPPFKGATYSTSAPVSLPPIIPIDEENKMFWDTFLFKTIDIDSAVDEHKLQGVQLLNETVPDTVTSWVISGITISNKFGLGITALPAVLNAFLYFYIDFNVPSFIKIGEVLQLDILLVNLFDIPLEAHVLFHTNDQKFDVIRPTGYNWTLLNDSYSQSFEIKQHFIYRLRIEIQPKVIGFLHLQVTASSSKAGDHVERIVKVLPEGFPNFESHGELIIVDECENEGKEVELSCNVPSDAVNDTTLVQAIVSGDILGPPLSNLDFLVRLPTGCGEQTMINFAPTVLTLQYLAVTNQLSETIELKSKEYLESGYQRMLKYRRKDGSFSAFGDDDESGSTWLTIYAAKYFQKASIYIRIDEEIVKEALEFVVTKQEADGRFREDGAVIRTNLQSGTGDGVAFTAYTATVLQENIDFYPQFAPIVARACSYVKHFYNSSDLYSLAISTNFLYLMNDAKQASLLGELLANQIKSSKYIYWKHHTSSESISSVDIEISAYALLIIDKIPELYKDGFKILEWLVSQQSSLGGFQSTQDTVIAIEAISKFALKFSSDHLNVNVELQPDYGDLITTSIDKGTSLSTQKFSLKKEVRQLLVKATGRGSAIVQLSCNYFTNKTIGDQHFDLSVAFNHESCDNRIVLDITGRFLSNKSIDASNMVVFRVDFPSGYTFDLDTPLSSDIQKFEELASGASVNVYFNNVILTSFSLIALRHTVVYNFSSSNVEVYDYYDTSIRASTTYKTPSNLPKCSFKDSTTIPPIDEFTTTEALPTTILIDQTTLNMSNTILIDSHNSSLDVTQATLTPDNYNILAESSRPEANLVIEDTLSELLEGDHHVVQPTHLYLDESHPSIDKTYAALGEHTETPHLSAPGPDHEAPAVHSVDHHIAPSSGEIVLHENHPSADQTHATSNEHTETPHQPAPGPDHAAPAVHSVDHHVNIAPSSGEIVLHENHPSAEQTHAISSEHTETPNPPAPGPDHAAPAVHSVDHHVNIAPSSGEIVLHENHPSAEQTHATSNEHTETPHQPAPGPDHAAPAVHSVDHHVNIAPSSGEIVLHENHPSADQTHASSNEHTETPHQPAPGPDHATPAVHSVDHHIAPSSGKIVLHENHPSADQTHASSNEHTETPHPPASGPDHATPAVHSVDHHIAPSSGEIVLHENHPSADQSHSTSNEHTETPHQPAPGPDHATPAVHSVDHHIAPSSGKIVLHENHPSADQTHASSNEHTETPHPPASGPDHATPAVHSVDHHIAPSSGEIVLHENHPSADQSHSTSNEHTETPHQPAPGPDHATPAVHSVDHHVTIAPSSGEIVLHENNQKIDQS